MPKFIDRTGIVYGRLTALRIVESKLKNTQWECRCNCGNFTVVAGGNLSNGHTQSCGCVAIEALTLRVTTHGHCKEEKRHELYPVWAQMKYRCTKPNHKQFGDYGGRGITVDPRWCGDGGFVRFLEDMGERPRNKSLDRINNNLGYSKENCRWASTSTQACNKRTNRLVEIEGVVKTVSEWATYCGLNYRTVLFRVNSGKTGVDVISKEDGRSKRIRKTKILR